MIKDGLQILLRNSSDCKSGLARFLLRMKLLNSNKTQIFCLIFFSFIIFSSCNERSNFSIQPNELTLYGEQSLVTQVCEFSDDYVLVLVNRKLIKANTKDIGIISIRHLDFDPYSLALVMLQTMLMIVSNTMLNFILSKNGVTPSYDSRPVMPVSVHLSKPVSLMGQTSQSSHWVCYFKKKTDACRQQLLIDNQKSQPVKRTYLC